MTDDEPMSELIELQTKIAHQEMAIEILQQTVFEQHSAIEKLQKNVKRLTDRFEGVVGAGPEVGPGNEKPPHY